MSYKPKSIILNRRSFERIYTTFSDWQAQQKLDLRTAAQRGISVGSYVMWRYMHNNIIVTDRAIVTDILGDLLTLQIKDSQFRTGSADIHEIVSNTEDRLALSVHELDKRATMAAQSEEALLTQEVVS